MVKSTVPWTMLQEERHQRVRVLLGGLRRVHERVIAICSDLLRSSSIWSGQAADGNPDRSQQNPVASVLAPLTIVIPDVVLA